MIILAIVTFVAASTAMLAVGMAVRDLSVRRENKIEQRLGLVPGAFDDVPLSLEAREPDGAINQGFARLIASTGSTLDPSLALSIVAGLGLLGCAVPLLLLENIVLGAAGLILGVSLPLCWWSIQGMRRRAAMQKSLPEMLDLLADGVRSGLNLERAADMVAEEMTGPLAQEFAYCASQLRLGHSPVAVLDRMVRRVPLAEFRLFAVAVQMHQATGGNLAMLTQRLARAARDRQEFSGHLKAVTAAARFSAVGLIAATVIGIAALMWINPEYLGKFMSYQLGPTLLTTAAVLQTVGMIWLWRILRVDY